MSGLIGKKIGMTSVFNAEGKNIPCTVIEAGPCVVTQVKTVEKDGYSAVQVAYDDKSEKNTNKCLLGHFKKAGVTPKRRLVEFKSFEVFGVELVGQQRFRDIILLECELFLLLGLVSCEIVAYGSKEHQTAKSRRKSDQSFDPLPQCGRRRHLSLYIRRNPFTQRMSQV